MIKQIVLYILAAFWAVSCDQGIDPITPVEPGPDETAPQVTIEAPTQGYQIMVPEEVSSVIISFEATDDIELETVIVSLNGNQIASFEEFKDYRRFVHEFEYDSVPNGTHELEITATDREGKSTSESVTFEKVPPYVPKYQGEIFYMPFDGDYMELNTFEEATVVGNPGFAGESVEGGNAYEGASESYLTFPGEALQSPAFSAVFWIKLNATPDRAGILVMSPPDPSNPDAPNVRTSGFRFFREQTEFGQTFKLNLGNGTDEAWFDGGQAASLDPATENWVHFAFTIGNGQAIVYMNGQVVSQGDFAGIDWTGVDLLSIMSGAPRFIGWEHFSDQSYMDELRLFNRVLSQAEIQGIIEAESGETPPYEGRYGEIFYMPFDNTYTEQATGTDATVVGNPGFADGISGQAYAGAENSYLTFPAQSLQNEVFSATFWLKVNGEPDRAGVLVMSPEDTENEGYPDIQNDRTKGFRFLRELVEGLQVFKLNIGTGESDVWFDGGTSAGVDPAANTWVHFAFSISENQATVYLNGEVVSSGEHAGIDWTGADLLTIMSGAPRFTEWEHFSDLSLMDELRIYDRVLAQQEIQSMMEDVNQ